MPDKVINLLNKGMITTGAINKINNSTNVTASQQYIQAKLPVLIKNHNTAAKTGAPIKIVSNQPFKISKTKVLGVVRLKPNFCSITKSIYNDYANAHSSTTNVTKRQFNIVRQ